MAERALRLNWEVSLKCIDCGATYVCNDVTSSVERLDGGLRMLLVTVPNECPECRSLHVVASATKENP